MDKRKKRRLKKVKNASPAQIRATENYRLKSTRRTVVFNTFKLEESQLLTLLAEDKAKGLGFSVVAKQALVEKYQSEDRWDECEA